MRIAVVGGGASGMAAAYAAATSGGQVTLFERNEKLGKKLYISGKGRCNLTNDSPIETHLENVVSNPRFLFSAYHALSPKDLMTLMEKSGVALKTERGNRVFPRSDKSSDVISAWKRMLNKANVNISLCDRVQSIGSNGNLFEIVSLSGTYEFDRVIVCTGGITYRATGSNGDGYRFAESFGLSLVKPAPALVGIKAHIPAELAGLSLKNVELSCKKEGKSLYSDFGEMLFTHEGISGPLVLSLSSKINRLILDGLTIYIDLKPALSIETLDARLVREFTAAPNKALKNLMPELMPKSLVSLVLEQAGVSENRPAQSITKAERQRLVQTIKGISIRPVGFEDINGAIVTAGGVSVSEIDPKTMQSKRIKGLFFAGEVLDVDALTGGFNLQIAFSTGYLAGLSAANA